MNIKKLLYLCVILFVGCSEEDNVLIERLDYDDTSSFMLESYEADVINVDVNGKSFSIFDELVFPDTSLFKPIFRIPSIIITNRETMLVATENRSGISDNADEMDILVSRKSLDAVKWSVRMVWPFSSSYGRSMNPIFVIDRNGKFSKEGRIYLFTCHINASGSDAADTKYDQVDMVYKYSDDDGMTWSKEYSIKSSWDTSKYTAVIPSCANGIQLSDGTLIIPTMGIDNGHYRSGLAYCTPNGTWHFSSPTPNLDDNESTVYQDNDGNIVLDCRTVERIRRKYIYDMKNDSWIYVPGSFTSVIDLKAEITKCDLNGKTIYLMTFCDTPNWTRQNITLYGSLDGNTWKKICRVQEGECHFAYSNVSSYNNKIALVYETLYNGTRVQDVSILLQEILALLN